MILFQAIRVIVLTTIGFAAAFIAGPAWLRFITRHNFGKQIRPSDDTPVYSALHQKKMGTPTGAGVMIWGTVIGLAILFSIAAAILGGAWRYFNFVNRAETYLPLAALLLAALMGFWDDWLGSLRIGGAKGGGLQVRHKAILYVILAAMGAWWFYYRLGWDVLNVPFVGRFSIGPWYIPLFIFIIFASAFSANETDGLDGLLGGVALFSFIALGVVSFTLGRYDLASFSGVLIGALLAFLWYNIYPARFFMGDTGSMALGITLGVMAMLTNTALLLPFFGFVLVLESLSVIVQIASRKIRHKKVFLSTPLHHHFEAKGWPESQVTMRFWILSAVMTAVGLMLFFMARF